VYNSWDVYEFCKQHRGHLLQLSYRGQFKYLKNELAGVNAGIIRGGLAEFRSVPPHNWPKDAKRAAK